MTLETSIKIRTPRITMIRVVSIDITNAYLSFYECFQFVATPDALKTLRNIENSPSFLPEKTSHLGIPYVPQIHHRSP